MQMKKIFLIGLLLGSISLSPVFQNKIFAQDGANANGGITIGGSGGGGVVLSGFAYDFVLGNGTSGHTVARGTIVASDPWVFTQTWNNAVLFSGFNIDITGTSYSNGSCIASFFKSTIFHGGFCDQGTNSRFNFVSDEIHLDSGNGAGSGTSIGHVGSNIIKLNPLSGFDYEVILGTATCASGCGTGPTITGNGTIGLITLGTTPNATTVVMGLGTTTNSAPICTTSLNRTTGALMTWTSTTTQVTFTGTFAAGNILMWNCYVSR